jgi:hypothetical protein
LEAAQDTLATQTGVTLTDDDLSVRFEKINDGIAEVFANPINAPISDSDLENKMNANEAALYAFFTGASDTPSTGNINLGWTETDDNGNVQNSDNTF